MFHQRFLSARRILLPALISTKALVLVSLPRPLVFIAARDTQKEPIFIGRIPRRGLAFAAALVNL